MPILSKETFCEVINLLEKQYKTDSDNAQKVGEVFGQVMEGYPNGNLTTAIFSLLQCFYPPNEKGFCPIEYFCFECGFGSDRNAIKLDKIDSAGKLYDYLNQDNLGYWVKVESKTPLK